MLPENFEEQKQLCKIVKIKLQAQVVTTVHEQ